MIELIKKLSAVNGTSGDESQVASVIIDEIKGHCEYKIDALGNIIAFKKGKNRANHTVMVCAHMDEVGLIITNVTEKGYLKFANVGGICGGALFGKRVVVGEKKVYGVIGSKPIHFLKKDQESEYPKTDTLYIDIGAKTKEEALEYVSIGDRATFDSDFVEFGDGFIKGKALDDRAGCAVMIKMIQSELEFDTYFVFTTQEEVGARGATVATYSVNPEFAIVLETTTAADIAGVDGDDEVCRLKKGPVISFMDRGTVYDRELYRTTLEIANKNSIKAQPKTKVAGGNDSQVVHKSRNGVRTVAVSMPCRYLHSSSCVLEKSDISATLELTIKLAENMQKQ